MWQALASMAASSAQSGDMDSGDLVGGPVSQWFNFGAGASPFRPSIDTNTAIILAAAVVVAAFIWKRK